MYISDPEARIIASVHGVLEATAMALSVQECNAPIVACLKKAADDLARVLEMEPESGKEA